MSQNYSELQDRFVEWLLLPEFKRGAIASEAEWGRVNGVSVRTIRRWKSSERVTLALQGRETAPVVPEDQGGVFDASEGPTGPLVGDEADYRQVKVALVEGAKSGNPKYLDLYFKTYGKPFVEEEVAARSTDLAGMDMDDLVAATLSTVNIDAVVKFLESQGWSVVRLNGDGAARSQ